jgi:hypothetical protein
VAQLQACNTPQKSEEDAPKKVKMPKEKPGRAEEVERERTPRRKPRQSG